MQSRHIERLYRFRREKKHPQAQDMYQYFRSAVENSARKYLPGLYPIHKAVRRERGS